MASDWREMTLAEAGVSLIDCVHKTPAAVDTGYLYIAIPQMTSGHLDYAAARRISPDDFYEWTRKARPEAHDVVLSRRCNPGETAYVRGDVDFALGQNLVLLRSDGSSVFPPFLRWLARSPAWWNQINLYRNVGAVFDSLKCADVPKFQLPIPPLPVQRRIADVLGKLDEKIELNRRMNRTLEKMAAAIFKSWFIDCDPVHAKAEGRDPNLPADIAALFPDSLDDSDLGPIPRGWKVRSLTDVIAINPKRTLAKGTLAPFLEMSNMPTRGPSPDSWRMRAMTSGTKFISGDTLVARITPCLENGKTAFVDFLHDGQVGWGSTEYIVLRPCGEIPPLFAYLLARTPSFRIFSISQMTGSSGRQRVPPQSLSKYPLTLPDLDSPVYRALGEIAQPFFSRIRLATLQNRRLAGLRDTLLPKLLSGEIELGTLPAPEAVGDWSLSSSIEA